LGKILGKDSGVRKDLLTFDYKEARKAGIIKRWKNGMVGAPGTSFSYLRNLRKGIKKIVSRRAHREGPGSNGKRA